MARGVTTNSATKTIIFVYTLPPYLLLAPPPWAK
jgi:hypothetical protein